MFYILFYIVFTAIFIQLEGAKPFRAASLEECGQKPSRIKSDISIQKENDNLIIASETYENQNLCNFTLVAPKMVINPYKSDIENSVQQKPFSSLYLKCAACLAVAGEISQVINDTIAEGETNYRNQDGVNAELSKKLEKLCQKGFKNYDLRRYNEIILITNRLTCTAHINSRMDGSWTKTLRDLCKLYTHHMDMDHISNNYKNKTNSLSADICNGSGIFRDCRNLDSGEFLKSIRETQFCDVCECKQ